MSSLTVAKFGGSSMGSAHAMERACEICLSTKPSLVVVSAVSGVTNLLENLMKAAPVTRKDILATIEDKHNGLCETLGINFSDTVEKLIQELKLVVSKTHLEMEDYDEIYSFGERISSSIFCGLLGRDTDTQLIDARKLILTDSAYTQAEPDYKNTAKAINDIFQKPSKNKIYITQGFIGSDSKNKTTTLGRGGSDFSSAILAEALRAKSLTIWTDTPGIYSADPRVVEQAEVIDNLNYKEIAEYAYAGAHIVYPLTVIPISRAGIPLYIKSTFDTNAKGTVITGEKYLNSIVHGIAVKRRQILITLATPEMSAPYGYLKEVFSLFADHKISIDQVITSETAISITLKAKLRKHDELLRDLEKLGKLTVEKNISVVSVVGRNITKNTKLAEKILNSIRDIRIRGVNQGASSNTFCLFVDDTDADKCVRNLHKKVIMNS